MNILVNCHGAFYLGLLSQVCRCLNALKDLSQLLTGMVSTVCMIAFSDGKISVSYNLYTQDMSEVASLCLARTSSSGLRLICHVCLVWACPLEMFSCLLPPLFLAVWHSAVLDFLQFSFSSLRSLPQRMPVGRITSGRSVHHISPLTRRWQNFSNAWPLHTGLCIGWFSSSINVTCAN